MLSLQHIEKKEELYSKNNQVSEELLKSLDRFIAGKNNILVYISGQVNQFGEG